VRTAADVTSARFFVAPGFCFVTEGLGTSALSDRPRIRSFDPVVAGRGKPMMAV
jgi:hypothetical protein